VTELEEDMNKQPTQHKENSNKNEWNKDNNIGYERGNQ
jgi:hypothetical protein